MAVIEVIHEYPVSPERLWAVTMNLDNLAVMNAPLIKFGNLAAERLEAGAVIETDVSVYGWLPAQRYRIEVLECDDAAMRARTSETGSGVKSWNHTITVTPVEGGARLTDRIEIDAGWKTPVFTWWARKLYRHRDGPRKRLLGLEA